MIFHIHKVYECRLEMNVVQMIFGCQEAILLVGYRKLSSTKSNLDNIL